MKQNNQNICWYQVRCWMISSLALLGVALSSSSCLTVDDFDTPHAQEVFTGSMSVDFSVKGISSGAQSGCLFVFDTSADGKNVTVSSFPQPEPFQVIPSDSFKDLMKLLIDEPIPNQPYNFDVVRDQTPTVSGLRTTVVEKQLIRVDSFAKMSDLAKKIGMKVKGTIRRTGKYVVTEEPIIFYTTLKDFRTVFPNAVLDRFELNNDSGETLKDFDDDTVLPLYRFTFKCQALTYV